MQPAEIGKHLDHLSHNLWWSWNRDARTVWEMAAAHLPARIREDCLRNPVLLVRALKPNNLQAVSRNAEFVSALRRTMESLRAVEHAKSRVPSLSWNAPVAYFSMEFGVHESVPIYAGGLGILAGDHAKSASDEGVPLVGVGLLYKEGYFRQQIDARGHHDVKYPRADFGALPLGPVRNASGKELRIRVDLDKHSVLLKVWNLQVGRTPIILLDSDIPENAKAERSITYRLYGGSRENRMRQEVAAGIGGVRALRAMGITPSVWHLNEGHVAFLTLERIREMRAKLGIPVAAAIEAVAADTVFTTHTPVPEGNEVFDLALARRYLAPYATPASIPVDEYLSLGLDRGPNLAPMLSMTVLAIRLSRFRNGVSALHGEVSRAMWSNLWPGFASTQSPIGSVTNGVHTETWIAPAMDSIFRQYLGEDWRRHLTDPEYWRKVRAIPERKLWETKRDLKLALIQFVREREKQRLLRNGTNERRAEKAVEHLLAPDVFTIGFARRFALYKRALLLFSDMKRAKRLFASAKYPVQIVFAGKPHPEDLAGQDVYNKVLAISRRAEFRDKLVLLENYDIGMARHIVQGVDLWLNTPRRPLEASGTSGQKVPMNGGLNASILDGWWCEGYTAKTGWAFGKPHTYADHALQDKEDAEAMYRVIEREILPLYYRRKRSGIPTGWVRKVKDSMAQLVPQFSTSRMVMEYASRFYRAAAANGRALTERHAHLAAELAAWRQNTLQSWPLVHARNVGSATRGALVVEIFLAGIDPSDLVCWDESGIARKMRVAKIVSPGVYDLQIDVKGMRKGEIMRLFPTHRGLPSPQELGISIRYVL